MGARDSMTLTSSMPSFEKRVFTTPRFVARICREQTSPMPSFVAYPVSQALWATQVFDSPPNFLDFLRFLCIADGDKAKREMGFAPRWDIRGAIADFLGLPAAPAPGGERGASNMSAGA